MNYTDFKNKVLEQPFFRSADMETSDLNVQVFRNQLLRWENQSRILKLRKGVYMLNKNDRKIEPSRVFIANQLCIPSYVSLEYALNIYGLIPERVMQVTSITSKKTQRFSTPMGVFSYQHIKPACFRGFKVIKDENGLDYFIAEPEKALIDYIYLNLKQFKDNNLDIFEQSYRLQNIEQLSCAKIRGFARMFKNRRLSKVILLLCKFIKKEKDSD